MGSSNIAMLRDQKSPISFYISFLIYILGYLYICG